MKELFPERYSDSAITRARQNPEAVLEMINREKTQDEKLDEYEQLAYNDPTLLTMIKTEKGPTARSERKTMQHHHRRLHGHHRQKGLDPTGGAS